MKTIKGNLILKKDTTFNESIKVEGDICGEFNLKVIGDIYAKNIDVWNIEARDIEAWNIEARDIEAWNINADDIKAWNIDADDIKAWNIDADDIEAWNINADDIKAWNIICEKRIKKSPKSKTICRVFIQNKSKLKIEEKLI